MGLTLMDARSIEDAFDSEADTLIVLENDLYRRAPAARVDQFLSKFSYIVALDAIVHNTTNRADLILPAAAFSEGDGTLVNNEGRAQRFIQSFIPTGPIQESWRWLGPWRKLDDILRAFGDAFPAFSPIIDAAPLSDFRIAGEKVPREPHRYSGRTAMHADVSVHEPRPPDDPDSPLSFSMEGTPNQPPPALIPFFWSPGWNSIQAVNLFQTEIAGPLRGGPSGVRLIEKRAAETSFYRDIPEAFQPKSEEWLVIALHHIFTSEELARHAPAVAELSISPYVALNPEDAADMGPEAEILGNRLPVRIVTDLPRGVAGLLVGVPPFEGVELPAWHRIVRIARAA
jgi:NADH-quinone oxidoreductase subunit G